MDPVRRKSVLPAPVVVIGLVSLFTDVSSEMMVPLLPAFLAARVANPAFVLGAMEGLADATAALLKLVSGRWVDSGKRLKPFVVAGYVLASVTRPLMGLVTRAWEPVLIRVTDRVGKGIRTSPRDAMIAGFTDEGTRGRAYGFHQAMDNGGAALGALLAIALTAAGFSIAHIFLLSAIPAAGAIVAVLFTREPAPSAIPRGTSTALAPVPRRFWAFLIPVTVFGLGNSTDAFVLLKLRELGAAPSLLPLAWLMLNAVKMLASYPAGALADRLRPGRVVLTGWSLYAASYLLLALSSTVLQTLLVICFYGLYHALSEGAEKALLTELIPRAARGRAFGLYNGLGGGAVLIAGLGFGALWSHFGSRTAFFTAGATAALSALLLAFLLPLAMPPREEKSRVGTAS